MFLGPGRALSRGCGRPVLEFAAAGCVVGGKEMTRRWGCGADFRSGGVQALFIIARAPERRPWGKTLIRKLGCYRARPSPALSAQRCVDDRCHVAGTSGGLLGVVRQQPHCLRLGLPARAHRKPDEGGLEVVRAFAQQWPAFGGLEPLAGAGCRNVLLPEANFRAAGKTLTGGWPQPRGAPAPGGP